MSLDDAGKSEPTLSHKTKYKRLMFYLPIGKIAELEGGKTW